MNVSSGFRSLVVTGLGLWAAATAMAATESQTSGTSAKVAAPIVAAADAASAKHDTDRSVLQPDSAAGSVELEPLTVLLAGLGVGFLLLLRRAER